MQQAVTHMRRTTNHQSTTRLIAHSWPISGRIIAARRSYLIERRIRRGTFGDSEQLAHDLVELVLHGPKRATAGLGLTVDQLPHTAAVPDGYSVVTEFDGTPRAVIRTSGLERRKFSDVDAEFAWDEGEGDRTLDDWKAGHWSYFSRECESLGRADERRRRGVSRTVRAALSVRARAESCSIAVHASSPATFRAAFRRAARCKPTTTRCIMASVRSLKPAV